MFGHQGWAMKKTIPIIAAVFTALLFTALFYKFGWKYTGFRMVSEPNVIEIHRVWEEDSQIIIEGTTSLKIGSFEGAVTEFQDGVLYVGIRFSIFGMDNLFRIPYTEAEGKVHRVVLKRLDTVKTVWLRPWEENTDYENLIRKSN